MLIKIVTTTSTREEAEKIGRAIIEKRLGACSQVSGPIKSIYPWKGNIESDEEWALTIKTLQERYEDCEALIRSLHSYEVPQIIAFKAEAAYKPYYDWLISWVKG